MIQPIRISIVTMLGLGIVPLVGGCPNTTLPEDAFVSCLGDADCPTGSSCQEAVGLCADDTDVAQGTAPTLIDVSPVVTPAHAKAGDVVSVTIEVDGATFTPPALTLVQADASRTLAVDEDQSRPEDGFFVSTYVVQDDDDEGDWEVHYRLVNRLGLVSEGVLSDGVRFDLTAPPVVEMEFEVGSAQSSAQVVATGTGTFDDTDRAANGELRSSTGAVLAALPFVLQNGVLSVTVDLDTIAEITSGLEVIGVTQVIDLAGNISESQTGTLVIDDEAPLNATFQFDDATTVSRAATFSASATDDVSAESALTIALFGDGDAINDGRWASPRPLGDLTEVTLGGDDGAKNVTAQICDEAGNCAEATDSIVLAAVTSSPALVLIGAGDGQLELGSNDDSVAIAGSATPGATLLSSRAFMVDDTGAEADVELVGLSIDAVLDDAGLFSGSITGLANPTLTPALVDGRSLVLESLVSFEGRASSAAESRSASIRIDRTPPQDVSVGFAGGATATSDVEVQLVLLQVGADEVFIDGDVVDGSLVRAWVPVAANFDVTLSDVDGDGTKSLSVQFRDRAHNIATASNTIELTTNVPTSSPILTSPWPLSAPGTIARAKPNDPVQFAGTVAVDTTVVSASIVGLDAIGSEPANCREVATITLTGTTLSGSGSVGTPCPQALSVVLEVIVANPALIQSIPQESWSAPLLLDTTPPQGISATLLPSPGAELGFTSQPTVDLELTATPVAGEPLEVFIEGDLLPGATTNAWIALDFESNATQQVAVTLTPGDGSKVIQVRFRDALENETLALSPSIVVDTDEPAALDASQLLFVEVPVADFDPAFIGQTTFRASGPAPESRVAFFDADNPGQDPLVILPTAAGFFLGAIPEVAGRRWEVSALDEAGNRSAPITAALPSLSAPVLVDEANDVLDGIFLGGFIEFESGTIARGEVEDSISAEIATGDGTTGRPLQLGCEESVVVMVPGGFQILCIDYVFGETADSEFLRANVFAGSGDVGLPQTTVVRVYAEAAGLAPGSRSTSAIALDIDNSPPLIDVAAIEVTNRAPGQSDEVFGAAGAVTDAEFASDLVTFTMGGRRADGSFVQLANNIPMNADGGFDPIALGDNTLVELFISAVDPANNFSPSVDLVPPDIIPPFVADLTPSPATQGDGGTIALSFVITDVNDLDAAPAVTIGGRAATFVSGALTTSAGPQTFNYTFVVDDGADTEGVNAVAFVVTDEFGNSRSVATNVRLDFTPPTTALESPAAATWNGLPALRGLATDVGSEVASVTFSIEDQTSGLYFDPGSGAMTSNALIDVTAAGTTSWTYASPIAFVDGRTYEIAFRATDSAGNTEATNTFTFTFDATLVDAPSALSAQSGDEAHVTLSWTPPAAADSYFVYYGAVGGTFEGRSDEAGDSPIEIPGPASGIDLVGIPRGRYEFAVTASVGGQQSSLSNIDEAASRWWEWKSPQFAGVDSIVDSVRISTGVSLFVGSSGTVRRFVDGVMTLIPTSTQQNLSAAELSSNTLIVGGTSVMLRSTDFGLTFTEVTANLSSGDTVNDIVSNGSGIWIASAGGDIHRSVDDGVTWTEVVTDVGTMRALAISGTNVVAVGRSNQIDGRIRVSTDTGATWSLQVSSQPFADVYGTGTTFVAVGNGGTIHRTTDVANVEFFSIALPPTNNQLLSIEAVPAGLAVGSGNDIYLSADLGETFELVHAGNQGAADISSNGNTVFAIGSPGGSGTNFDVAKSTDGGLTWANLESGARAQLQTVVYDGDRVITMGSLGAYAQSFDGGLSWTDEGRLMGGEMNSVYLNGDLVVVAGRIIDNQAPGFVARSTDGGESFSIVDPGVTDNMRDVHGAGDVVALATISSTNGGNRAGILVSNDQGATFGAATFVDAGGSPVSAVDVEKVWVTEDAIVAGSDNGIFWSIDGGATFTEATINPTPTVRSIWGTGLEFVVVGDSGLLATTLDGGASWQEATRVTARHYRSVYGDGADVVAVASNSSNNGGFISRRTSPTTWTLVATPTERMDAVWGEDGTFVAGGGNNVHRSADGGQSFAIAQAIPLAVIGALDGSGDFVVGTNTRNFPDSVARVSFDQGQSILTPTRTANGALTGFANDIAVDDGVAVVVGFAGTIGVYGPR